MFRKPQFFLAPGLVSLLFITLGCQGSNITQLEQDAIVVDTDPGLFLTASLATPITTVACTLSDGTATTCYQIEASSYHVDAPGSNNFINCLAGAYAL